MIANDEIASLALTLRSTSRRGRGRPYPAPLRERVLATIDAQVARGASPRGVARALGIPQHTIDRWRERQPEALFRPVVVEAQVAPAESASAVVVHGPRGLRIEGLDLATLAELLRRLA